MARTGMNTIYDVVRGMCDLGTADYTLGTAVYWDSHQLEHVLDRHRTDIWYEQLEPVIKYVNGSAQYYTYLAPVKPLESGSTVFWIETGDGTDISTASYTVDYLTGIVTFAADTEGTAYYMTGRTYDLNAAAADIWRIKAGQAAKVYNISTDGHNLSRGQLITHYLDMARYYESLRDPVTVTMTRSDVPGSEE